MKHKKGKIAGMFAGIGAIFHHLWSHGIAEEVTSIAVDGAKFLRKKVGETTEDAKTNTADDDLWDMVLHKANWGKLSTNGDAVRKYCHLLKNDPTTKEYGCALVLFIAKKLVRSFERWEKTRSNNAQESKKGRPTPTPTTKQLVPYLEGIDLASLWLDKLMQEDEKDRIKWMENEGVFDLITPDKRKGLFAKMWDNIWFILFCCALFIVSIIRMIN